LLITDCSATKYKLFAFALLAILFVSTFAQRRPRPATPPAGFKIVLDKKKEQPSDDKRSRTTRHLVFEATITPGIPK
jgi:hypothetical protein